MGMFARARCFQRPLGWWSMAADAKQPPALFDPTCFETFRFTACELDASGRVTLRYALDDEVDFVEVLELPIGAGAAGDGAGTIQLSERERMRVDGLLALLHWVAGVSYYKTALPRQVSCETGDPPQATAVLLEALYSEGLGELAYVNGLSLPRLRFAAERTVSGEELEIPATATGATATAFEFARKHDSDDPLA